MDGERRDIVNGMSDRSECITSEPFTIPAHQKASRAIDVLLAGRFIHFPKRKPGHLGKVMVYCVIVIVQKQQTPEPRRFVDDGAMLVRVRRTMFLERADRTQRQRSISHTDNKDPRRDRANMLQPGGERGECGEVRKPHRHIAPFTTSDLTERIDTGRGDGERGPDQQAADKRITEGQQRANRPTRASPRDSADEVTLGIALGIRLPCRFDADLSRGRGIGGG